MLIHRIKTEISTALSPEEIERSLSPRAFDIRNDIGNDTRDYEFWGRVNRSGFKLAKNPSYNLPHFAHVRNSFIPIITGNISSDGNRTKITLTAKMHILIQIFVFMIELGFIFPIFLGLLMLLPGNFSNGFLCILCGAFLVGATEVLLFFAFHRPAKMAIERLEEILIKKEN